MIWLIYDRYCCYKDDDCEWWNVMILLSDDEMDLYYNITMKKNE